MPTPHELMQIGRVLVEHCTNQTDDELRRKYYTDDAISVEAVPMPTGSAESIGRKAIEDKNAWWSSAHELHQIDVEGPFIHGTDRFSVIFSIDATEIESGERSQMREIATYYVTETGQISREEFSHAVDT